MNKAPKKLVPFTRLIWIIVVLMGWAAYRLYRDYQEAGAWESVNVSGVVFTVCVALLIGGGIYWYANKPEPDDRKEEKADSEGGHEQHER